MSTNAQQRADIAGALDTIPGIAGHTHPPAAMNTGDAWPQWRGGEPRARGVENTWVVLIVAGPDGDDVTADAFADGHLDAILDALRPHLSVDRVDPALIPTEAGNLNALAITGRSE